MKTGQRQFRGAKTLRLKAETALSMTRGDVAEMAMEDVQKLVHELQVHEIELRMQNDELLRTQREVEAVGERYSLLYNSAPCAYLTLTESGEVVEGNRAAATLLNVDLKSLSRKKFTRFIQPESQDAFYHFRGRMRRSQGMHSIEIGLKAGPANRSVAQVTGFRATTEGVPEYRLSLIDLTDRKETQARLEQSERNLSAFFDQAPIGLQWLSQDGAILRANQTQLDLLGYAAKDYVGHRLAEFADDKDAVNELTRRLSLREVVHNLHASFKHRDGSARIVLIDAIAHWNGKQFSNYSVFTRDITYRIDLEKRILEISEREQKRFAQDLHDDLGQLLTGTLYLMSLLKKKLNAESPARGRDAGQILKLLDRSLTQTRRLARGLHPVRDESNGLMSALEELAERTVKVFHRDCVLVCPRTVDILDNDAATHLFRIAQEAVTNAIKHGKARRIRIELARVEKRIVLSVTDNGSGLAISNTGMGLRIMQYRAAVINGLWDIQAAPGGGTLVTCSIPVSVQIGPSRLT